MSFGGPSTVMLRWRRGLSLESPPHVPTVAESVLYQFDVFQVVFDDADQMTYTFLLLLQVLKGESCRIFQMTELSNVSHESCGRGKKKNKPNILV